MAWLQLIIDVTPEQAPRAEFLLEAAGALSIVMTDAGTEDIYEPLPDTLPLWSQTRLISLFDREIDVEAVAQQILNELTIQQGLLELIDKNQTNSYKPNITWRVEHVPDQDWESNWQADVYPLLCGKRLWICTDSAPPQANAQILWMQPGLAFGTGTHPTTALCLEWLDAACQSEYSVIDYGCGSGILGLAALQLGAKCCWAVDHDPQALRATCANALKNEIKVSNNDDLPAPLWVGLPEQLPKITADLLLANILMRPLIELANYFANLINTDGYLVLSGILTDQAPAIITAYQPWFKFHSQMTRDGWMCLIGCKIKL